MQLAFPDSPYMKGNTVAPTWQQISDEANYEPSITTATNVDGSGFVDWQADDHIVTGYGVHVSAQAGGWRSPDDELTAGVLFSTNITADVLSIGTARQIIEALQAAIVDAEMVDADAALVPAFSGSAR